MDGSGGPPNVRGQGGKAERGSRLLPQNLRADFSRHAARRPFAEFHGFCTGESQDESARVALGFEEDIHGRLNGSSACQLSEQLTRPALVTYHPFSRLLPGSRSTVGAHL